MSNNDFDFGIVKGQILKSCNDAGYNSEQKRELIEIAKYFYIEYYSRFEQQHNRLTSGTLKKVIDNISYFMSDYSCGVDEMKKVIDRYFNTSFDFRCDYSIVHFSHLTIMENRYFEIKEEL